MDLLNKLGIDWRLLIAQIINFVILLLILKKFLYKPILKVLDDRSKKIDKSLKDAQKIESNLAEAKSEKEKEVLAGKMEANQIVEKAKEDSEKLKKEKVAETKKEIEKIIKEAKNEIKVEREEMVAGLRAELADLILLASGKLTGQSIDKQTHLALIDQAIEEFSKAELK